MKTKLILASAIAMALSGAAIGQQQTTEPMATQDKPAKEWSKTGQQAQPADPAKAEEMAAMETANPYDLRASDIIGREVKNSQDDDIGEVDDLIITKSDNVVKAVIAVGGFLGIGEKLVAVPYNELQVSPDRDYVMYEATKDQLKSQPEFNYKEGEMRWMTGEEGQRYRDSRNVTGERPETTGKVDQEELQEEMEDVREEQKDVREEQKDVQELKQKG